MSKIHRVTRLRVFDFETSPYAYAVASNKNPFGYSYQNIYYFGKRKIYDGLEHDNVEDYGFYWLAFNMNHNQLKSLKKRVEKMELGDKVEFVDTTSQIEIKLQSGSSIVYQGTKKEEFIQKVLTNKF